MYLKSVTLQGFKSFYKKTKIEFNKSITAVVGPNGSGKSNITDAITWVLGETSAKNLRGSKMEDVIFSGTDKVKPLGFAEVEIIFDNSDKSLNIDFNEVSVTRRMYRSLESEFYINNTKCRLKDIRELFMDTGIGKDGYSLIGQGKIESILSDKPQDRRAVFEEAAGISKIKFKKLESQNKLLKAEENLIRLNDIIEEIKIQEETLKIQSEEALKYKEIYEDLKIKDINFVYFKTKVHRDELEKLEEKKNVLKEKIEKLKINLKEDVKEIEELDSEIDKIDKLLNSLNENYTEKTTEFERLKSSIKLNVEKIERENSDLERIQEDIAESKNILSENEKNVLDKKRDYNNYSEIIINIKEEISKKSNDLEDLLENIRLIEDKNISKDKNKALFESNINNLEFKNETLRRIIEEKEVRLKNLNDRIENFEKNDREYKNSISENKKKLELKNKNIKELELNLDNINNEIFSMEKDIKNLEIEIENINKNYNTSNTKLDILKNLSDNYEGYNRSVKSFMNFCSKRNLFSNNIFGTVGENLIVDKKYEKAISVSLGGAIQNIIVDSTDNTSKMIKLLIDEKLGRVTFMALDRIKSNISNFDLKGLKNFGAIDYAINLIDFNEKYRDIYSNLLSRIIVIKDFKDAKIISEKTFNKFRIVSLNGDVFNTSGSITGGYISKSSTDLISRKNEIKEREALVLNLKASLEKFQKNYNKLIDEHNIKNKDKNSLLENYTENKNAIEELKNTLENMYKSEILNREYLDKYKNESEETLNSKLFDLKNIENNELQIENFKEKLNLLNVDMDLKSSDLNEIKEKSEISNRELLDLKIKLKEYEEKKNYLNLDLERTINDNSNLLKNIENNESRVLNIENNLKKLELFKENGLKDLNILDEKIIDIKKQLVELKNERSLKNNKLKELRINNDTLRDSIFESTNSLEKNNAKIEKKEFFIENSIQRIKEEYDVDSLEQYISKEYINIREKEIKDLNNKLKTFKDINLAAISEYELIKERLDFNLEQRQDLIESRDEIKNIIKNLEFEMKNNFKKSFEEISKHFNEIFKILFNGGKADILIEGDILESGIEIKAQPPGKKFQTLSLLSGGERALTAVSLLFALLKVRPAPFCILDEIDAALDDANIKRYSDYLMTLNNIQFVIITHRKLTMEIANRIYGVTMEEKGVSSIYSVELN